MKKTIALTIIGGLLAGSAVVNAADITGKVTLKGTAPKEKDIPQIKDDPNCGKLHTAAATTHHYVVGSGGELANCVVTLVGAKGGSGGASAAPVVLDQKNCEYSPMIFAVQAGQKITVKNSDPVMHNVHAMPKEGSGNKEENKAQMPGGGDLTFSFPGPEEFLKFQCEVHNWMFSWVTVCDSPYFAVTGPDGTFKISNVPAGKYTVQVAHRKAGKATQEVEVKDSGGKADFTLEAK
jgi:plastocyanin